MDKKNNIPQSVISTSKCSKELASYIWDSPCLKIFFFNPFLLALLIIIVILIINHMDGIYFEDTSTIFLIQHMVTTFIIVSGIIVLNNMLIKYKYREEKEELKKILDELSKSTED
jgi:hypothetical protein